MKHFDFREQKRGGRASPRPRAYTARRRSGRPSGLVLAGALLAALGYLHLDPAPAAADRAEAVSFMMCGRDERINCVVDGDTFYFQGEKVRIADIDTPETFQAGCPEEKALGRQATQRLHALLNEGPFELQRSGSRDTDRYGRKLRLVSRDGRSLGDMLVTEGLARQWTGRRQPWCA